MLAGAIRLLYWSLRKDIRANNLETTGEGKAVFAFWHGKMLTGWLVSKAIFSNVPVAAVVSLSKDGAMLAGALHRLGLKLIRGSSSRGKEELKQETRLFLSSGGVVAITPDGPRGAQHVFKYGSVRLAAETGSRLLFARITHHACWRLRSWDRFEIPKPFSRVSIEISAIDLPPFETDDALKAFTDTLTAAFADRDDALQINRSA